MPSIAERDALLRSEIRRKALIIHDFLLPAQPCRAVARAFSQDQVPQPSQVENCFVLSFGEAVHLLAGCPARFLVVGHFRTWVGRSRSRASTCLANRGTNSWSTTIWQKSRIWI